MLHTPSDGSPWTTLAAEEGGWDDFEHVLERVTANGLDLQFAVPRLQADLTIVTNAVRARGDALQYASEELRAHPDVVRLAVSEDGFALRFASKEMQANRTVGLAAVNENGAALLFLAEELRRDRDVVREAVREDGFALCHAHLSLQSDVEIVSLACEKNGMALQFAHPDLAANEAVALTAVRQAGFAIAFASESLRDTRTVVTAAVIQNYMVLNRVAPHWRADKHVVLAAVQTNGRALCFAHASLRAEREVVLAAVREHGLVLHAASRELRANKEIVLAAIANNPLAEESSLVEDASFRKVVLLWIRASASKQPFPLDVLMTHEARRQAALIDVLALLTPYVSSTLRGDLEGFVASLAAPSSCGQADGGCWANSLHRAGIFVSVQSAKNAFDAQIDAVLEELRSGGRQTTREEVGVPGETWHARVIDKAAWQAGFRITQAWPEKQGREPVDLRTVLREGTYVIDGIQNKVFYHGKRKVNKWGAGVPGPETAPAEWFHAVCVKGGKVLDWEYDDSGTRHADGGELPLSVLWLGAGNTIDLKKAFFRKIRKVYMVERRSDKRKAPAAVLGKRDVAQLQAVLESPADI